MAGPLRLYLVDDEPLAISRLERLVNERPDAVVAGTATDPLDALGAIPELPVDGLLLDIQMPGMNGFEVLGQLRNPPPVVFTTAYDNYALRAFEVNSIDYLLKPVEATALERALTKLRRFQSTPEPQTTAITSAIAELAAHFRETQPSMLDRVPSRVGERVVFLGLDEISHFYSKNKLTYALAGERDFTVDFTLTELEQKLDPSRFLRVHRSALVNVAYVRELHPHFAGKIVLRLADKKRSEVAVSRDRVKDVKKRLGVA